MPHLCELSDVELTFRILNMHSSIHARNQQVCLFPLPIPVVVRALVPQETASVLSAVITAPELIGGEIRSFRPNCAGPAKRKQPIEVIASCNIPAY
jgi:hypothetical protein